jgi:hypothetical protein
LARQSDVQLEVVFVEDMVFVLLNWLLLFKLLKVFLAEGDAASSAAAGKAALKL